MKKLLLFIVILSVYVCACAQESRTLHFMPFNPYADLLNPATDCGFNGYVGLPFFSNLSVNVENTGLTYNRLFKQTDQGKIVTLNKLIDHLHKSNRLNLELSEDIFSFGFKVGRFTVTAADRVRVQTHLFYPQTLLKLPLQGNMDYVEKPAEMKNLSAYLSAYNEFSIGLRWQINQQWAVAFRPKLLTGFANVHTADSYFLLTTDPDDYSMRMQEHFLVHTSFPLNVFDKEQEFSVGEFIRNLGRNFGAAIDLGATWQITPKWSVGLSMCDIGFIRWRSLATDLSSEIADGGKYYRDGDFYFSGIDVTRLLYDEDYPVNIYDSLKAYFPIDKEAIDHYTTATYARFIAEGHFQYLPNQRVSAMVRGDVVGRRFVPSLTVAWNATFANFFNLCVNYTMLPHSYANFGLGIGFAANGFQFYVATDNLLACFNALNARTVNIQSGIVFNWGKAGSRKSKEKAAKEEKGD